MGRDTLFVVHETRQQFDNRRKEEKGKEKLFLSICLFVIGVTLAIFQKGAFSIGVVLCGGAIALYFLG